MSNFGGSPMQMQGPPTGWCDYCHQKPKFPPYNYCGKVCGSRAKASGNIPPSGPPMCKQCVQKPVFKGHQFCGRNCANTWQAMYGQINTGGHGPPQHGQQSWGPMPPGYTQNPPSNQTQPLQGFNGGGGGIKSMVMTGLKGIVSGQQPQQPQPQYQPGPHNPQHTRQIPGPTSQGPMMISPPITPMSSGGSYMSSGMGGQMPPGGFDPMPSGTPTPTSPGSNHQFYGPTSPTRPGQDPNANDQTNGQYFSPPPFPAPRNSKQNFSTSGRDSNTMSMAMNPRMTSHDPDFDPRAHADPNQEQTPTSIRYPNPNQFRTQDQNTGGHGNGSWESSDSDDFTSQQSTSTSTSPGPPTACRLQGCNKPVLVDPLSRSPSEYCSQKHREEARIFGEVGPCIMCMKMPRGTVDHFCSKTCRDKALSPF